jgi:ElaB/YqjD/DUF883 family membrane-anchored ribosome-binding protein
MSSAKGSEPGAGLSDTRETEEVQEEILQTREELGATAGAAAEKTDVKGQASAKTDEVKRQAGEKAEEAKEKTRQLTDSVAAKAKEAAPDSAVPTIEKAQKFANEQPLLVVGGALLAVIVLGRLISR